MPFFIDGIRFDETLADPVTPAEGQAWYNIVDHRLKLYADGTVSVIAHLSDLEAGNVLVNATNFGGILSPTDTDVQTALETIDSRIYTGTTAPVSPVDGTLWYNTAAGWETLMAYDAGRTKWLSTTEWTVQFGHDSADGQLLRGFGINIPATNSGFRVPRNACVRRITARTLTTGVAKLMSLYVNGAPTYTWTINPGVSDGYFSSNSVNVDLSEGNHVWVYVDSALTPISNVAVCIWCSWRA